MSATLEASPRLPGTCHVRAPAIRFQAKRSYSAFSHRQTKEQNIYKTKNEVICQDNRTSMEFDDNNYP